MNIYRQELRVNRNSTVIWVISLVMLAALFLSFYPSFYEEAEEFTRILQSYPEEVLLALDIDSTLVSSYLSYYAYIFTYMLLGFAIQAMNVGIGLVNREVNGRTAEFLLSKPVRRYQLLSSKLLAALTCLIFTNILYTAAICLLSPMFATHEVDYGILLLFSGAGLWMQLLFLMMGLILAVFIQGIKSPVIISTSTVFSLYVLNMLSSFTQMKGLQYVSPFQYFDTGYMIEHSSYEWKYIWLLAVLIIGGGFLVFTAFSHKDIKV